MELLGGWRLKAVIAGSILLACILLLLLACQLPRWLLTPQIPRIPFDQLGLGEDRVVLGKGPAGLVLKGTYRGMAVAVKRVTPPEAGSLSIFDVVAATETEEDALLVGELRLTPCVCNPPSPPWAGWLGGFFSIHHGRSQAPASQGL